MSSGPTIDWSKYEDKPVNPQIDFSKYEDVPATSGSSSSDWLDTAGKFAKDVAGGFGAGATQTITGVSRLINKIPGVGETLAPSEGIKAMQIAGTPTNTGERVGAGIETAAEMAAGEGAIKSALMKIPELAKYAPFVRIGSSAAASGGVAAAHGQDPTVPTLLGAGGSALSEALPGLSGFLNKSAAKNYEDVLNPTKQGTKFQTQKIMPQLLQERPIAASRQGLQTKAEETADQYGQQIEQQVQSLQGNMRAKPVLDSLDKLRNQFVVNGVNLRPEVSSAIDTAQDQMKQMAQGGQLSFQDAVQARRILDKAVNESKGWGGYNISDASLTNVRKEFSNSLRNEISKANPDLAALNAKFSFWKNLSDVMEATISRKTGQVGAFSKLQTVIAAGAGMASGGVGGAVEAGAAMKVLNNTINSTGWNTISGATKSAIADALSTGKFSNVISLLGKGGAAASVQSSANPTP
jgi:hypothetical protein